MLNFRLFFAIILIFFGFSKCTTETPVPEVRVNFVIDLNNPLFNDINAVGNSVYVPNRGYKGIIITRTDIDKFIAYDAACTYNPNNPKALVEIDGIQGICSACGSKYSLLLMGYVEEGPATTALKNYHVKFNMTMNTLYIFN